MTDYKKEEWLLNIPLWAIEVLEEEIKRNIFLPIS